MKNIQELFYLFLWCIGITIAVGISFLLGSVLASISIVLAIVSGPLLIIFFTVKVFLAFVKIVQSNEIEIKGKNDNQKTDI